MDKKNYELHHWGIKGMKWGVRRYQNSDGTLTDAGKKRYDRDVSGLSNKKKNQYNTDPNKWVREDRERSKRLVDDIQGMTNKLKNINDKAIRKQTKPKMDLSQMSDKEMRDQINRAMLERQYNEMFAPETTNRGRERVSEVLEVAGDVLAVTSSALAIAISINTLMKGS